MISKDLYHRGWGSERFAFLKAITRNPSENICNFFGYTGAPAITGYAYSGWHIKTQSILIYIFVIILALAFLVFVLYLISLFLCAIMEFFIDVHRYTTRKSMNEDIPTRSTMTNRPTPGQGRPPIQNNRPDPSRTQRSI